MGIRKFLLSGLLASSLVFGGSTALAQESTPASTDSLQERQVSLAGADNSLVATALFVENDEGVTITVTAEEDSGLEPGEHGIHIHENGVCTPTEGDPGDIFSDAGDHFNPADDTHGGLEDEDSHAGDLGNLTVEEDGTIDFEVFTDQVTLIPGEEHSLASEFGTTLIIHAEADDLETDPTGESGDRVACGTIYQHPAGTPVATPDVDEIVDDEDDATPES